jgi:two-component system, chemotaxis family, chemotaxis protein CheY
VSLSSVPARCCRPTELPVTIGDMSDTAHPVLIVDDDADTRAFLELALGLEGFAVVTANDGEEALAVARTQQPCLILLDLMMPRMDGFAFRDAQMASPQLSGTPVIVISAIQDADQIRRRMGPVPSVFKPIELETLMDHVFAYCDRGCGRG